MNQNTAFTDKHLASLAAIMLLAPAVSFMLKEKNIDIAVEEEGYVRSYIRFGYYILMVLGLAFIVWGMYSFFFSIPVLYWVNYGLLGVVILMIVMGIFSIINNKTLIDRAAQNTAVSSNPAILLYFLPLYNFYLWYNEKLDEHNYRWVKESVLWRSTYIVIVSIWPTAAVVFLGLLFIAARCIMVTIGMDIISLSMKNKINTWFHHNIEEFIAYPLALIIHPIKKLFQKGSSLLHEIESRKLTYTHLDSLSHRRTIVSYLIAVAAIGYRGYVTWLASGPTVGVSLALLPQILLLGKILMTVPSGKLPRIPILYTLLGGRKERISIPTTSTPPTQAKTENTTTSTTPL